jgi:large subunit ribosomal protein L9
MDVILLQRVDKLGQMGDVVKVRPGYARNFLLPQKKAVRATDENRRMFEQRRAQLEVENLQRRGEAEAIAVRMDGLHIVLIRQAGESGQLYGSVSSRDIADGVTEAGFTVGRQQVELLTPIKTLGVHPVSLRLHPEVSVRVLVNVARSAAEAEVQRATGAAVSRGDQRGSDIATEPQLETLFESDEAATQVAEELNETLS